MAGFGADTDYAGFADTARNPNGAQYSLIRSSKAPAATEAQAGDSNGDVIASTLHDTITTRTSEYVKCTDAAIVLYDTLTAVDFRLGKVRSSFVLQSVRVGTSPDGRPKLTMVEESCPTADSLVRKIDPSDLAVSGARKATKFGFSVDTVSKLNSAEGSAIAEIVRERDSQGNTLCVDIKTGRVEGSHDFVSATGAPGGSADTGWTLQPGIGINNDNAGYNTGSATVFKNLASTAT